MKKIIIPLAVILSLQLMGQVQVSTSSQFHPTTPGFETSNETKLLKDVSEAHVNYSTGTAIIDLPIYNISSGGINLPVTLNYATDGIKVDDEASWVGLGWILNAGATISRQIKGRPDESYYLYQGSTQSNGTVMPNQQWIQIWQNDCQNIMSMPLYVPTYIPQSQTYGSFFYFFSKSAEKLVPCASQHGPTRDIQPDLYTANLNGKKIEFIFDLSQKAVILNDDGAYKIQHDGYNFTILDEIGTKYFFQSSDAEKIKPEARGSTDYHSNTPNLSYFDFNFWDYSNAYNVSACSGEQAFGTHSTPRIKWNLTKIESPDGKRSIDLEYDDFAHYQYSTEFVYSIDKTTNQQYSYYYYYPVNPWDSHAWDHGTNLQASFNCYYAKRLKKISWQNGYMTFEAGALRDDVHPHTTASSTYPVNDYKSLSNIKVFDNNNVELHRFTLNYSYFNSTITTNDTYTYRSKRLKLTSLTEYASDLSAKPPYLFEYDATPLPVRLSFEKDFWGYHKANGADHMQGTTYYYPNYSNTNLSDFALWSQFCIYPISLPGSGTPQTFTGVNRLPNLANTQACVLKKITYPLKGYQQFDYELNTFCIDNDLVNRDAGGLRIKKITTSDGVNSGKNIVKNFYYDYESTTLPNSTNRSSGEINFLPSFGRDAVDVFSVAYFNNFKIHSDNFASSVNSSNSQVFYREVKVEEPGKGSTIYKFDNAGTFGHNNDVYSGTSFLIEKNKTDVVHVSAGLTYPDRNDIVIRRANFPYAPEPNTDWANGTLKEILVRDQTNNTVYKKTFSYTINNYSKIKIFDPTYFVAGQAAIGTDIHSSFAMVPYYYLSVWRVLDNETEYVYDPAFPNNLTKAQATTVNYSYLNYTHKFLTSKSTTESNGKTITQKYRYVGDFNISNPASFSADIPSIALLNMRYKTNQLKNPVETITTQNAGMSSEILSGSYVNYKDLANTSAQSLNTPVVRSFETYAFENSTPLSYSFFNPAIFSQNGTNLTTTFDSRFKRKITNQYFDTKGNLLQSKLENGPETSYQYGYNGNVTVAEAINTKYTEMNYTSFESEEVANWSHNPANIVTNDKKTGDKCYSFGPAAPNTIHYDLILDKNISNVTQDGKYIFSCWIKTPSNFVNYSAHIVAQSTDGVNQVALFPNVSSAYRTAFITNTNGKWVYFSTVIDLKKIRADAGLQSYPTGPGLGIRFFMYNSSNNVSFYVDDIRIQPYNSLMSTITSKPLIGITSQTDGRNTAEVYEYDVFGRPSLMRDLNNNILEKKTYNYR